MASSVEDLDTLAGFQTYFAATAALVAAIPGGLHRGRLKKDVDLSGTPSTIQCYAMIDCEQGPQANIYPAPVASGSGYKDYRKVTFTVMGLSPDVEAALKLVRSTFEWQPKTGTPMTIPNADHLVSVMPLKTKMEQDPANKKGFDIWRGSEEFQVCTGRKVP